jgi:hypothetical protein
LAVLMSSNSIACRIAQADVASVCLVTVALGIVVAHSLMFVNEK